MRWHARGDEPYFGHAHRFGNFLGEPQVAIMYRIKGSAENPEGSSRHRSNALQESDVYGARHGMRGSR